MVLFWGQEELGAKFFLGAVFIASLAGAGSVCAQALPQIDAGSLLQEQRRSQIFPQRGTVVLPQEPELMSISSDSMSLDVRRVHVSGATVFPKESLEFLITDLPGENRTLGQLKIAAARITAHYRRAGYTLARAYLPQQKMQDGIVTIEVLEGKLEGVKIDNASRLSNEAVGSRLSGVKAGDVFNKSSSERALLLLSDTPGAGVVDSRFVPGSQRGESVLVTRLEGVPLLAGRVEADNHGGLYTGRNRIGVSADLNSALGLGERFSGKVLASDAELYNARLAAQVPVSHDGLTLGAAVSHNTYALGNTFKALDAVGRSSTAELNLRYPWVRSVDFNVYAQVGYEYRKLKDDVRSTSTVTEKHANVGTLSAFGDARDGLGRGGLTQASVMWSQGQLAFDSPGAEAIDALGAKTAGSYSKLYLTAERQQRLPADFMLNLSLRGQWTDGNLDSSEKFGLGGPYGVRAFASSEALGDRGWLGSAELRYAFSPSIVGSVFHDRGEVSVNASPYLTTPNTLRRSGNGFGVTGSFGSFDWRASVAWREGKAGTAEPDRLPRMWAQAGWRF